jgi:hypothetical protein
MAAEEYADLEVTQKTLDTLRMDMAALHQWMLWARIGRELSNLVGTDTVAISMCGGKYVLKLGLRSEFIREQLLHCLEAVNQVERTKVCCRCKQKKILEAFAHNRAMPDGRWRYCLVCERQRVAEYKRRRSPTRTSA